MREVLNIVMLVIALCWIFIYLSNHHHGQPDIHTALICTQQSDGVMVCVEE